MNDDDFDELDRALFALPLATPPPGMREAILRATIHAPVASPAFTRAEIVISGCVLAVAAWMLLVVMTDPLRAGALSAQISAVVRFLADPETVVWLGTGCLVAALFTLGGSFLPQALGSPLRRS
jgi:hypothetical protein